MKKKPTDVFLKRSKNLLLIKKERQIKKIENY
jgi:hypothetical protein